MNIVWHDVANLLSAAFAYTTGIAVAICFLVTLYLTVDLVGQLFRKE